MFHYNFYLNGIFTNLRKAKKINTIKHNDGTHTLARKHVTCGFSAPHANANLK